MTRIIKLHGITMLDVSASVETLEDVLRYALSLEENPGVALYVRSGGNNRALFASIASIAHKLKKRKMDRFKFVNKSGYFALTPTMMVLGMDGQRCIQTLDVELRWES